MPTVDLDAFRKEQAAEPVTVRLPGGRELSLPPALPAGVALEILELRKDLTDATNVTPEQAIDLATRLVGAEGMEVIRDSGTTLPELAHLLLALLEIYAPGGPLPNQTARKAAGQRRSRSSTRGR